MKKWLLFISMLAIILTGCCKHGPAKSRKKGEHYYPFKICSLNDLEGSSCVEYAVKKYDTRGNDIMIWTLDWHKYRFNHSGWAWIITVE